MNDILEKSIAHKTPLEIIYMAGSQPGRKRLIQPVAIDGDKLRAICLETGLVKSFFIHKIDFDTSDNPESKPYISGLEDHQDDLSSFDQICKSVIAPLTADGWHVIITEESMGVYLKWKNGTPHKTAEVDLLYYSHCGDEFGEWRPSVRPWYVRGKKTGTARTFKYLQPALEYFIELAKQMKEINNDRRAMRQLRQTNR
jgi:hypothetical protein